ncbi:phage-like protein [Brachyspira pilosicoli WesB]|uniref:Phage-like protein n=1 Tax=Brachyspira pilosicoli WesB TaxID=1161918 RepID=K0JGA2_BRAPL|nr:hypothetical protein [Brachyspira pilosicoli]CCG55789.1 phage-like protein [Brachyspira pilosicoli WesB]
MGRKKITEEQSNDTNIIDSAIEIENKERMSKEITIEEVEKTYFTDTYDYSRMVEEIKFYQEQAGNAFIEMGKRLLRIKAHEEHGMFMLALEELGIAHTTAKYSMVAARKFANSRTFGDLGVSKIQVLTVLEDEEVKELEDTNQIFGMTFDEIDKMSVRELKKNLREAKEKNKQDRESLENVIKQKEEKNNELERQVRGLDPISKERIAQEKCEEIAKDFYKKIASIEMDFFSLKQMINQVQSIEGVNLVIIEEFQERFSNAFSNLEDERQSFYDIYDNPHVYTREEQLEHGVIKSYGDDLKDEKRYY